jgi:hypothetical protein
VICYSSLLLKDFPIGACTVNVCCLRTFGSVIEQKQSGSDPDFLSRSTKRSTDCRDSLAMTEKNLDLTPNIPLKQVNVFSTNLSAHCQFASASQRQLP